MAKAVIPVKAKLFIGILTSSEEYSNLAEELLTKKFGDIDYKTANIPFMHTDYYNSIGKKLFKVFISFQRLIPRENIVNIKLFTNKIENKISKNKIDRKVNNDRKININRTVNIDPGYITLSNVYLASCKEYFHRAYLDKGIYLENELKYVEKRYQPWDWTYPDYKKREYLEFFYYIRKLYYQQISKQ